jgi:hypothetical protein
MLDQMRIGNRDRDFRYWPIARTTQLKSPARRDKARNVRRPAMGDPS